MLRRIVRHCVCQQRQFSRLSTETCTRASLLPTAVACEKKSKQSESESRNTLSESLARLHLGQQLPVSVLRQIVPKQDYVLPPSEHSHTYKKTILDPVSTSTVYRLPTVSTPTTQKLTPGLQRIVPIEDPHPLQKIIDQGVDVTKQARSPPKHITIIRRRKVKKHHYKKWKKKHHKLIKARKMRKKRNADEKVWEAMRKFTKLKEEFDAEQFVDEKLALARKGGWGIDLWAQYKEAQRRRSDAPDDEPKRSSSA